MGWIDSWNHFLQTGAVGDYLSYRESRSQQEAGRNADHNDRNRDTGEIHG